MRGAIQGGMQGGMWRTIGTILIALLVARVSAEPTTLITPPIPSATVPTPLTLTTTPPTELRPNYNNYINVDGGRLGVSFVPGQYVSVECELGVQDALDRAWRVAPAAGARVPRATVKCAAPRAGYRAALRRLNLTLAPRASLALYLPSGEGEGEALRADHLAGLDLSRLVLSARTPGAAPPRAGAGLLAGLALTRLEVRGVALPEDALTAAPRALASLTLVAAGAAAVPAATLATLTALVASERVRLTGSAPRLTALSLTLAPDEAPPAWARFPAATRVSLTGWGVEAPPRWDSCAAMTSLTLTLAGFSSLPPRWLAACAALDSLELKSARRLSALPPALLEGECAPRGEGQAEGRGAPCEAPALTRLVLRYCALKSLPETLFDPVPNLRYLDLNDNELHSLPGGIFARPIALTTLILSRNRFEGDSVYLELGALRALSSLDLSGNKRLGDACTGGPFIASGDSHLRALRNLTVLKLSNTSVSRICRDWRLGMPRLRRLVLRFTDIARLTFDDLQHTRDNATLEAAPRVELEGSRVRRIEYAAEDEPRAASAPAARVAVALSEPLACDCGAYRAVRAMREWPQHALLEPALRCESPARPLPAVPLDDLVCPAPALCPGLPAACACESRERGAGARALRVRVTCERAGLTAPPALVAPPGYELEWDLRLAGNRISELDALPQGLVSIDLRDNALRGVSARAAAAISDARRALLAGNPLRCDCAAAPLLGALGALAARAPAGLGLGRALCEDGRELREAALAARACPAAAPLGAPLLGAAGAALGALALAALALGATLARPERRARLKGVLLRWGWLPRAPPTEAPRPYDVFVSFAHEDAALARELAARLEAGPRALRLCLHSRDWAPGEYIDAQIAASVRCAHRTLALVSRAWLRSRWARVELREALGAAREEAAAGPRLVLVLLEPAGALPADRELRRCLATCTYLQRDHPKFWERLRDALPDPPPPAAPPPAPPPDPTPASA